MPYRAKNQRVVHFAPDPIVLKPNHQWLFKDSIGYTLQCPNDRNNLPPASQDFLRPFDNDNDAKELSKLDLSHLDESTALAIKNIIKKYFPCFRAKGVKTPVRGYEMTIDTGDKRPVSCSPRYGLHESGYMQTHIKELLENGFIEDSSISPWSSPITLAPKPHQEHVTSWDDYIWRFCINYIRLNQVTKPSDYPIPRCDDATMAGFGAAKFFILLDAYSGYHQVAIAEDSRVKTAFHAPHGRKYQWKVMPFGLRNAPAIFIAMMHDLKALWDILQEQKGVPTDHDNGTTIIVDDNLIFARTLKNALIIFECVCIIAMKYHLTWKLKKAQFFPKEIEFVGVDIAISGNSPARSKFNRLNSLPRPSCSRESMAFLGFTGFYSVWIPYYEHKINHIRESTKVRPLDRQFSSSEWKNEHTAQWTAMKNAILSHPILQRPSIHKRFYLKSDFSKIGLGYALCQPSDEPAALAAMNREINGGECEFEATLTNSELRLRPIGFGMRKCTGNEQHLHSHPGEGLSAIYGIGKNRHYLWGKQFTLVTDHRALMWLKNYSGHNHIIKRLQLELFGYDFTICNRPERMLGDANYLSRVGSEMSMDPLLSNYEDIAKFLHSNHTPESDPEKLTSENTPGRKPKRVHSENNTDSATVNLAHLSCEEAYSIISDSIDNDQTDIPSSITSGLLTTSNIPVIIENHFTTPSDNQNITNDTAITLAASIKFFYWILFEPGFCHFIEASNHISLNNRVVGAIDSNIIARNHLQVQHKVPIISDTIDNFLLKWKPLKDLLVDGYYSSLDHAFSKVSLHAQLSEQATIINALQSQSKLGIFLIEIRSTIQEPINNFIKSLELDWTIYKADIDSTEFSDLVQSSFTLLTGVIKSSNLSACIPIIPPRKPNSFQQSLTPAFNKFQHAIIPLEEAFDIHQICHTIHQRQPVVTKYLKVKTNPYQVQSGFQIYDIHSPAPSTSLNQLGIFGSLFGIEFQCTDPRTQKDCTFVRAISINEYLTTFGYHSQFALAIQKNHNCINMIRQMIPVKTMSSILSSAHIVLTDILKQTLASRYKSPSNPEETQVSQSSASILNGIVFNALPNPTEWMRAYTSDPNTRQIIKILNNPQLHKESEIRQLHYLYRQPMRDSMIKLQHDRLYLCERIAHQQSIIKLIIVPSSLQKMIFTTFHANPLGAHYSLYYTHHRIRIRYHWPSMYQQIKTWIKTCAACVLKHTANKPASELMYTFPLDEPMNVVHADAWVPGKFVSFDGAQGLMITICNMTGFAAIEQYSQANSKSFSKALYTIGLRYGLPGLYVTDADSKFNDTFTQSCTLLNVKHHKAARGHHDAILVERFNSYLNSTLRVFCNDHDSIRTFFEGAAMAVYAWNSAPVSRTDLSRSLLVCGREFKFPIDFEDRKHTQNMTIEPVRIHSFAEDLLQLLSKSREIYKILIQEHRTLHRELRNSQIMNPRKFQLDDIVFTIVESKSNSKKGISAKLQYTRRGPYKITKVLQGGSYILQKLNSPKSSSTIKKHGNHIYHCPSEIIPFKPTSTSDQNFASLDKKTQESPYQMLGIRNYEPAQPFSTHAAAALSHISPQNPERISNVNFSAFVDINPPFPSCNQLDQEIGFSEDQNKINISPPTSSPEAYSSNVTRAHPVTTAIPTPSNTTPQSALTASHAALGYSITSLLQSQSKLYFISYNPSNCDRKEWKLISIDVEASISKHPTCFQTGKFLANFFIQHPNDSHLPIQTRRFWLEYHTASTPNQLRIAYHLIPPSSTSAIIAQERNLVPFREWITLNDKSVIIHGPFNFDTITNRPSRDRINIDDWKILKSSHKHYDDVAALKNLHSQVIPNTEPPQYTSEHITKQVTSFLGRIQINDQTLNDFHAHYS